MNPETRVGRATVVQHRGCILLRSVPSLNPPPPPAPWIAHGPDKAVSGVSTIVGGGPLQREQSNEAALIRAALMTGSNELGAGLSDLGGVDGLANGDVEDLDALGVEFDLSQFKDFEAESDEPAQISGERVETMGGSAGLGDDLTLTPSRRGGGGLEWGWEMSRESSFGISGGSTFARQGSASMMGGEHLSHQSSLDIYTIMQVGKV